MYDGVCLQNATAGTVERFGRQVNPALLNFLCSMGSEVKIPRQPFAFAASQMNLQHHGCTTVVAGFVSRSTSPMYVEASVINAINTSHSHFKFYLYAFVIISQVRHINLLTMESLRKKPCHAGRRFKHHDF